MIRLSIALLFAASLASMAQGPPPAARPGARPPAGVNRMQPGPAEGYGARDAESIDRGKRVFVASCGFCHGSGGTGGEGGPDLIRSVLVLHDRGGDQLGPVILNGRPDKGMPKLTMSQTQIADISNFLHDKMLEKSTRRNYKIQDVVTGNATAGKAYFDANCAACHSPTGDLKGIAGKFDPVALQQRFLFPRMRAFPGQRAAAGKPTTVTVTEPSGKPISGTMEHLDDFNVSLRDSSGTYHSWRRDVTQGIKVEIHDPLQRHQELLEKYSDKDMHNILAYLETMK